MFKLWRDGNRKKLNKKGMTLVEVLVAMTILTIVVTPTLRMFASSLSTNLRSRRSQRAITIGESVMETFKAYTMENLCKQFLNGEYKFAAGASAGTTTVTATFPGGAGPESPLRVNKTLKEGASEYLFTMTGASMDSNQYDIDIKVKPVSSPTVLNFESYNAYTDAFIKIDESTIDIGSAAALNIDTDIMEFFRTKAKEKFFASHASTNYFVDSVELKNVKRYIHITISDEASSGVQKVFESIIYTCDSASVEYHYSVPDAINPHALSTGTGTAPITLDISSTTEGMYIVKFYDASGTEYSDWPIYDNSGSIAGQKLNNRKLKLNNVYLYYFPMYASVYGNGAEDIITVTSTLSSDNYGNSATDNDVKGYGTEPLNFYIVRQCSTTLDDTALNAAEVGYNCRVNGGTTGGGEINLYHTYHTAAYEQKLKDTLTDVPAAPTFEGSPFTSIKPLKDGIVAQTNLIYELEVDVYEAGTGKTNLLTQYTGTINE